MVRFTKKLSRTILPLILLSGGCTASGPNDEIAPPVSVVSFEKGSSLYFASYLSSRGGTVYKENGIPTSPFVSLKAHGATMVRLMVEPEIFHNEFTGGEEPVDYLSFAHLLGDMRRAKDAGLQVFLTLKPEKSIPRCWQDVKENRTLLGDSLYDWTYRILDRLGQENLLPALISVGNETNLFFMTDGYDAEHEDVALADKERNIYFINRCIDGVKAVADKYRTSIPVSVHVFDPAHVRWYLEENMPLKPRIDFLSLSYYYGWHSMGEWNSWGQLVSWLDTTYGLDLFLLETAVPWSTEVWKDDRINTYQQVYPGYPATPAGQARRLRDLRIDLEKVGALGMMYWGGDWISNDRLYVYPDRYGKGSSWENCTFWDLNDNLHEGIDWMK